MKINFLFPDSISPFLSFSRSQNSMQFGMWRKIMGVFCQGSYRKYKFVTSIFYRVTNRRRKGWRVLLFSLTELKIVPENVSHTDLRRVHDASIDGSSFLRGRHSRDDMKFLLSLLIKEQRENNWEDKPDARAIFIYRMYTGGAYSSPFNCVHL